MNLGRIAGLFGAAAVAMTATACDSGKRAEPAAGEIVFSILSAQGQASAAPLWQPLLEDMAEAVGAPVRPYFASTYDDLVEAMSEGRIHAGWFSAQPAARAVDTAGAEVLVRTIGEDGADSYRATLIVRSGSGITLKDVMACGRRYDFGAGDPRSTSGTLAPQTFLFRPRGIDPETCFRAIRPANHEANAFAVASGTLDVATSNTVSTETLRRQNPAVADQIQVIWRSPALPESGILVRGDLDPAVKEKIRSFFLTYGQGEGAQAERQRRVLASLGYSRFSAADEDYLDPVREMMADQALSAARAKGDAAAVDAAQRDVQRLRAKREVRP